MDTWNSANAVPHYGKDGDLTGPDKEHAETSMLALHLLQSSLDHVNTLLLQQVLAEGTSNISPYDTFRLNMDKRLELSPTAAVPRPRTPADTSAPTATEAR
ncbi:hypothetical protein [Streptomyces sp. NPDC005731]|uniref:hypothetical protein n=1 Tax=Streptomyces sp. NPDC005731 TaxID=3157056 RepID=UPI00340F8546